MTLQAQVKILIESFQLPNFQNKNIYNMNLYIFLCVTSDNSKIRLIYKIAEEPLNVNYYCILPAVLILVF